MSRPRKAKRPRTETAKSIWNSKDDWDTLVAESRLSTSSISRRPPPPAGLKSLTEYCAEVAGRSFKRFWELDTGISWKYVWSELPDRLKLGVREEVYRHWGGYLTTAMISEVFCHPPYMYLPAQQLPTIASAERLIPFRAKSEDADRYTRLTLRHAEKATDTAIAGLIHSMPQLEDINLKGCTLAGQRTVETICKRCKGIKKLNLKGTNVNEMQMRDLLDAYGKQLEVFKIDRVVIESPEETFIQDSYPKIRKLCLPGDMLQPGAGDFRRRRLQSGDTIDWPAAKRTADTARIRWENIGKLFPSLTHLSLPSLWLPESSRVALTPNTLVKLDLGHHGPPVPFPVIRAVIETQHGSLRHIALGSEFSGGLGRPADQMAQLGQALAQCESLQHLDLQGDIASTKSFAAHAMGSRHAASMLYCGALCDTNVNLKRLTIRAPGQLMIGDSEAGWIPCESQRAALQELRIPSANVADTSRLAKTLATCFGIHVLDVSGISFTDEEIFTILDGCPNLHTIDLTSCRGIKVQNRRNIFKAWQETRAPISSSPQASPDKTTKSGRAAARKRKR